MCHACLYVDQIKGICVFTRVFFLKCCPATNIKMCQPQHICIYNVGRYKRESSTNHDSTNHPYTTYTYDLFKCRSKPNIFKHYCPSINTSHLLKCTSSPNILKQNPANKPIQTINAKECSPTNTSIINPASQVNSTYSNASPLQISLNSLQTQIIITNIHPIIFQQVIE